MAVKIAVKELKDVHGSPEYKTDATVALPAFTKEHVYGAVRNTYGFSDEYMAEATIHMYADKAAVVWDGIPFNVVTIVE